MVERFLPVRGSWDIAATLQTLQQHTIPGAHRTDLTRGTHSRLLTIGDCPEVVHLRLTPAGVHWTVGGDTRSALPTEGALPIGSAQRPDPDLIEQVLRWWFDLDTDIDTIDDHLRTDPVLAEQVEARPGVRITRHPDAAAGVLTTILGQQVSLAAGRTFAGRLVAAYGEHVRAGLRAFPTAAQVAAADAEGLRSALGLTGARARTVQAAATLLAAHPAPTHAPHRLDDDLADLLADVPGIGPWTMSIVGLRTTGDDDALPASDLVLRRAMGGITAREVSTAALAWHPYRSYAVVRLWAQDG